MFQVLAGTRFPDVWSAAAVEGLTLPACSFKDAK